jgi:hypothetical protein
MWPEGRKPETEKKRAQGSKLNKLTNPPTKNKTEPLTRIKTKAGQNPQHQYKAAPQQKTTQLIQKISSWIPIPLIEKTRGDF